MKQEIHLSVDIPTSYTADNNDALRTNTIKIDKVSHYLNAIFWFMHKTAQDYDLLDLQTDTKLYEFHNFRANVESLSEIGMGLADCLTLFSNKQYFQEEPKTAHTHNASAFDAADLGKKLAEILSNPELPACIYNPLVYAIDEIANNTDALKNLDRSPEYLTNVFTEVFNREVEEND